MAASPRKPGKPKVPRKAVTPKAPETPFEMDDATFKAIEEMLKGGVFDHMLGPGETPQELIEALLQLGSDEGDEADMLFGDLVDALSDLRIEANSGNREARREAEDLRTWLRQHLEDVDATGPQFMMLGQAFGEAGLDPGPGLQAAITRRLQGDFGGKRDESGGKRDENESLDFLLDSVVDEIDADPLLNFESLSHLMRYMPAETRLGLAETLATNPRPQLREISLGFLLSGDDRTAAVVCDGLIASVSRSAPPARLLSRLALVRALVSPALGGRIEGVINTLGPHVVSSMPEAAPKVNVSFSAVPDGAGASTIVTHVGKGRSSQMASMLFKAGQGLIEANLIEGISKTRLRELFANSEIREYAAPMAHVARRIAAALPENRASGTPVPPMIVRVMELLGLSSLPSDEFQPQVLFDDILAGALQDPSSPKNQQTAFYKLLGQGILSTWFEANDEIDALLRKIRPRDKRMQALLTGYLPTRRWFWIGQCAWTAALLREQKGRDAQLAVWAAVLGKQLCSNGSLAESPLMQEVAEGTIKAFTLQ